MKNEVRRGICYRLAATHGFASVVLGTGYPNAVPGHELYLFQVSSKMVRYGVIEPQT